MRFNKIISIISLLFGLSILLSACGSSDLTETPIASTIANETATASITPTSELSCSIINVEPTPALSTSPFSVNQDDFILGLDNATVTVIQYCDLQSVECYGLRTITNKLLENHPKDMRLVIRPIPLLELKGFENSKIAIQALIAAKQQSKYREMYNLLFDKYPQWANLTSTSTFEAWIVNQAPGIGLDKTKFQTDLKSKETITEMTKWYNLAKEKGVVPPYPLVLINGTPVNIGLLSYDYLDQTISLIALGSHQFDKCPPFSVDPAKQYIATLHTEKGDIVIQLFADKAPLAVNSFVFLANQGWFNSVTFHRVVPGFVAEAGDPSGTGQGNPGYFFKNEISDLRFDKPGMVGMANSGPDTNGSQFFITYAPEPRLDGKYTIFGQVISGMEIAEKLTTRDPQQGFSLPPGDKIMTVNIVEK